MSALLLIWLTNELECVAAACYGCSNVILIISASSPGTCVLPTIIYGLYFVTVCLE